MTREAPAETSARLSPMEDHCPSRERRPSTTRTARFPKRFLHGTNQPDESRSMRLPACPTLSDSDSSTDSNPAGPVRRAVHGPSAVRGRLVGIPSTRHSQTTGLRIRRLGVRIPSGALCVETEQSGLTSGNAGRVVLVLPTRRPVTGATDSSRDSNRAERGRSITGQTPHQAPRQQPSRTTA